MPGKTVTFPSRMQGRERRKRRMPVEPGILGEGGAGGRRQSEPRTELAVERILGRKEHRERIGAAVEEHADEHPAVGATRRPGRRDPVFEGTRAQRVAAVDGHREPERTQKERAAIEPRSRRGGHPRLDRRQPAPCMRDAATDELGAVVLGARAHDRRSSA